MKKTTIYCTMMSREKGMDFKAIPAYYKIYTATDGKRIKLCFHHPDFDGEKLVSINPVHSKMWRCSEYFSGMIATPFRDTYRLKDWDIDISQEIIDLIATRIMNKDYVINAIKTKLEKGLITPEEIAEFYEVK